MVASAESVALFAMVTWATYACSARCVGHQVSTAAAAAAVLDAVVQLAELGSFTNCPQLFGGGSGGC